MYAQPSFDRPVSSPVTVYDVRPLQLGQRNTFTVDASRAGNGAVDLTIGPSGCNLPHNIRDLGDQRFEVSFVPEDCQDHYIGIQFNGSHVPGSPFTIPAPAIDFSGITVTGQGHKVAKISVPAQFTVNCSSAKASLPLNVIVTGTAGQQVPAQINDYRNRTFFVEWTPATGGVHLIDVTYGGVSIPGSPFKAKVTDPLAVRVTPPPLALKGRTVEYKIDTNDAGNGVLEGSVQCNGTSVASSVQPDGPGSYTLSFTPTVNGPHRVSIQLDGKHVPGSPFSANVTGGAQYVTINERDGYHEVGDQTSLEIDARFAGEGQLMAEVRSPNNGVENELRPLGNKTYELSFTPVEGGLHTIIVTFNHQEIPQSPYKLLVQPTMPPYQPISEAPRPNDTQRRNTSNSYQQLQTSRRVVHSSSMTNLPPSYSVNTELPHATRVAVLQQGQPAFSMGDHQTYIQSPAHQIGDYPGTMQDSLSIRGSAFHATSAGIRNDLVSDSNAVPARARMPMAGTIQRLAPPISLQEQSRTITYSPQPNNVVTNESAYFELNSHGLPISDLDIKIADPMNVSMPFEVMKLNDKHRVSFVPRQLGTHMIYIHIDGVPLPGSPYMYFVQHHGGVKVHGTDESGRVGEEFTFTVDYSEVDANDVTVDITNQGHRLATRYKTLKEGTRRYTFIPEAAGDHAIDVCVNYVSVAGSPFKVIVNDPLDNGFYQYSDTMRSEIPAIVTSSGKGLTSFAVSESNYFILEMHGRKYSPPDIHVDVRAPSGELIAANLVPQKNNEIKVEYQSPYVGRHSVDIFYKGKKLPGCPYYVEVFDPKKVSMQHMASASVVQEQTEFEVVAEEAGRADMECRVLSPSGLLIPCRIINTPRGMTVKYTPVEPGTYYVHTFIGGVEIPGSPMTQTVYETRATLLRRRHTADNLDLPSAVDSMTIQKRRTTKMSSTFDEPETSRASETSSSYRRVKHREKQESSGERQSKTRSKSQNGLGLITVHGTGLCYGEEDKEAVFYIDTHGMHGTPVVHVEGPNSMAKVHIDPHGNSSFKVTYVPVEVGLYAVHIKWLDEDIEGSPFRACVVDQRKVQVHGGWQSLLDAQGRLPLVVNEVKRVIFNTIGAGPGRLKAEVKHVASGRTVPVSVDEKSQYEHCVSFVPTEVGEYVINVLWSDRPIQQSPIRGIAISGSQPVDYTKVILTGKGLREAYAGQRCEFVIDGSQAGQGIPHVVLRNSELQEMQIPCEALGFNRYRCWYTAPAAGEYFLYVSWSDRELRDSPFHVVVTQSAASEASRVAFNKSLTKTGLVNQSFTTMIDAQLAGSGELVARCIGPSKTALCELIDQGNGQYMLSVKPRETGQHFLEVTYAGHHIAGSPHTFSVGSPPDPSKVRVTGPGVEDGVLATLQSHFFVHTQGAGAGSLSVRVRGPKGGFNVAMRRPTAGERTIECTFNPVEVGLYIVTVRWSDIDVPGSPFYVHIFDTPQELERFCRYGSLPPDRREFTYLSPMAASEPMLNTLVPEQQYHTGGHRSYRTSTKTKHYSTVYRPSSSLGYH